jgi:hypothetical protein
MVVGSSPKSVSCRHAPSDVPSVQMFVVTPSASPIASESPLGDNEKCGYIADIGNRTPATRPIRVDGPDSGEAERISQSQLPSRSVTLAAKYNTSRPTAVAF